MCGDNMIMWRRQNFLALKSINGTKNMRDQVPLEAIQGTRITDMLGDFVPKFGSCSGESFGMGTVSMKPTTTCRSSVMGVNLGYRGKNIRQIRWDFIIYYFPKKYAKIEIKSLIDTHPFECIQHVRDVRSGVTIQNNSHRSVLNALQSCQIRLPETGAPDSTTVVDMGENKSIV